MSILKGCFARFVAFEMFLSFFISFCNSLWLIWSIITWMASDSSNLIYWLDHQRSERTFGGVSLIVWWFMDCSMLVGCLSNQPDPLDIPSLFRSLTALGDVQVFSERSRKEKQCRDSLSSSIRCSFIRSGSNWAYKKKQREFFEILKRFWLIIQGWLEVFFRVFYAQKIKGNQSKRFLPILPVAKGTQRTKNHHTTATTTTTKEKDRKRAKKW